MKILWFPRLQMDIDKLHITTWREMCKELKRLGNTVEIAICGLPVPGVFDDPHIYVPIIPVKGLRLLSFWILGFGKVFIEYLRFKPDVVILDIYSIWFALLALVFGHKRRTRIVMDNRSPVYNETSETRTFQDVLLRAYTWLAYRYCIMLGGGVTTITQYYKETLCREFKMASSQIEVWGSGVDNERFNPLTYANTENHFSWKGKFVVIQHGEVSYNRGIFETIKAMKLINDDNVTLVIVGSAINNAEIDIKLNELIHDLKLSERVYRVSAVPYAEVPRYLNSADCAIMAYPNIEYWNNNNPIKLLEYLSMGKVIICTDMWTFRDVCETKRCAVYIRDNGPEQIAEAITLCYKNRHLLSEWGKEGINIIKERFTWKRQAETLVNFIESIKGKDDNNIR